MDPRYFKQEDLYVPVYLVDICLELLQANFNKGDIVPILHASSPHPLKTYPQ